MFLLAFTNRQLPSQHRQLYVVKTTNNLEREVVERHKTGERSLLYPPRIFTPPLNVVLTETQQGTSLVNNQSDIGLLLLTDLYLPYADPGYVQLPGRHSLSRPTIRTIVVISTSQHGPVISGHLSYVLCLSVF